MDMHRIGLLTKERGINKKEGIFFYTPSDFTQHNLLYILWGARYACEPPYSVVRAQGFSALLIFYIETGCMTFTYGGEQFTANAGDSVLIDCRKPHSYRADSPVTFSWFHFQGELGYAYTDRFWSYRRIIFKIYAKQPMAEILHLLSSGNASGDELAFRIQELLSRMAQSLTPPLSPTIQDAKNFIEQNLGQPVSIEAIAAYAGLSRYHFSRLFHQEMGVSPYRYLLNMRLEHAKKLLSESSLSIEVIAEMYAFYSASNFIRLFHKYTGMTPLQFRHFFRNGTNASS